MSSSLLLHQYPTSLVYLTWVLSEIESKWLYSCCFVGCCFQDMFKIACYLNFFVYVWWILPSTNSFQFCYLCLVWDFKWALDLHTNLQIVYVGELADRVAGMIDWAFIFTLNTLKWILSNVMVALWHFALQSLLIEATCLYLPNASAMNRIQHKFHF